MIPLDLVQVREAARGSVGVSARPAAVDSRKHSHGRCCFTLNRAMLSAQLLTHAVHLLSLRLFLQRLVSNRTRLHYKYAAAQLQVYTEVSIVRNTLASSGLVQVHQCSVTPKQISPSLCIRRTATASRLANCGNNSSSSHALVNEVHTTATVRGSFFLVSSSFAFCLLFFLCVR